VHAIQELDCEERHRYCEWLLAKVEDNPRMLDVTSLSDEGLVPSYRLCELSEYLHTVDGKYPIQPMTLPFTLLKTGVWCAVSPHRVVGPIFFDDTINMERYMDILLKGKLPKHGSNVTRYGGLCESYPCSSEIYHFERSLVPMFAGFVTTTFIVMGLHKRQCLPQ
jgi:hypothetical protein